MRILITGAAGFIGSRLMQALAERDNKVVGVDNLNDYYDTSLKYARLNECGFEKSEIAESTEPIKSKLHDNNEFVRLSIDDSACLNDLLGRYHFDKVVNLAAQAGVRYSITNPYAYMQSNMLGFLNILECCRNHGVKHLIFASSSSVYGLNNKVPYNEDDQVDTPVSLYAASKKSDELMAHAYSKLYGFATTGLRYFTVYGPWGRPDMAPMLFAKLISSDIPIKVFNNGDMMRDFTYIDDIVSATIHVIYRHPNDFPYQNDVPYRIYNVGCSHPIKLLDFINEIEAALGKTAQKVFLPMQPGDVYQTYADTSRLQSELGFKPQVPLRDGIKAFIDWYQSDENPLR